MAAPVLTPLPAPPTRANPADFAARADTFMGALPDFVTQVNDLVAYWNTNLDTTAFINRNVASTMEATLTFAVPPVMRSAATAGDQVALTLAKGATQRQSVRLGDDGSINIIPLNGAVPVLKVNGQAVYHPGNKPTAADLGLVSSGSFTAANILNLLKGVDGASSGLDADLLDGQEGAYYLNAANMTGTFSDARAPSTIARTSRNLTAGDGLTGGGNLAADRTFAVDGTVARRDRANTFIGSQVVKGALYSDASAEPGTAYLFLRANDGTNRGLLYAAASTATVLRSYALNGTDFADWSFNQANGVLTSPGGFSGAGSLLTALNASQLTLGTIPDARISANIARSTTQVIAGDGLSGGGTLAASRTLAVDATVVRTTRQVLAGNGMVGGGQLNGDRTITMGTPSTIGPDSGNAVTATSHTHALPAGTVGELTSRLAVGAIGTYALLSTATSAALTVGTTRAGSALYYTNGSGRIDHPGFFGASSPPGTWQLHGIVSTYSNGDGNQVSLWKRIA